MHPRDRYLLRKSSEDLTDIYGYFLALFLKLCWFLITGFVKVLWWCLVKISSLVSNIVKAKRKRPDNTEEEED